METNTNVREESKVEPQPEWTEADHDWAAFRLTHPELYSDELKASKYWPYVLPAVIRGVR